MKTDKFVQEKYGLFDTGFITEIPNMGRDDLAALFCELGYKIGVEIGTQRGYYASDLCKANPDLELICVDPWTKYDGYRATQTQKQYDDHYNAAVKRLADYNVRIIRDFSPDAAIVFDDESLDFVYIDGNHLYDSVMADLEAWTPKVRKGGIISGHDYFYPSTRHNARNDVPRAVKEYMKKNEISPLYIVGTKASLEGEKRDRVRSWFWVKS